MTENLFFEVYLVKTKEQRQFNPVSRKIIDVRVFSGYQLEYSSIAARYIEQAKNNQLITEQKQLRLEIYQALRYPNYFPFPRRIDYTGSDNTLYEFNSSLQKGYPLQLDVHESVDDDFVSRYSYLADYLCDLHVKSGKGRGDTLTDEEKAFYAISAYMPPVNGVGEAFRRFTKACGCCEEVGRFYGSGYLKTLMAAATRRWEGESRDLTLHRLFGLGKLLWHVRAISGSALSQILCACCGNNSLTFAEAVGAIFQYRGIFDWITIMKEVTPDLVRAGFARKLLEGINYAMSEDYKLTVDDARLFADVIRQILQCPMFSQKWVLLNNTSRIDSRLQRLPEGDPRIPVLAALRSGLSRK